MIDKIGATKEKTNNKLFLSMDFKSKFLRFFNNRIVKKSIPEKPRIKNIIGVLIQNQVGI